MNRLITLIFIAFIFSGCMNNRVTDPEDYRAFLEINNVNRKNLDQVNTEIDFWQKRLTGDTGNFVNMLELAANHIARFKVTGQPSDLKIADSFYSRVIGKIRYTEPEILFSVSQNAITQHKFRDAWKWLELADSIGVNPFVIRLLKFDAAMEIGLYNQAYTNLESVKNENSFDYLIRKAKWEDHAGRLEKAIEYMEKALDLAVFNGDQSSETWARSNLGDMYGHAGKISDAYQQYLTVLRMDSSYLYALKGIAWIAYSHDGNTAEAKRILHYVLAQTNMPEIYMMLAEIAEWEHNEAEKKNHIDRFISIVSDPQYGDMYNKYLIDLYAGELNNPERALMLAEKEVSNRPTPETYDWLAWVYFQQGDTGKAFEIAMNYVRDKTSEPDAVLRLAFILDSNGEKAAARKLFKECLESSFELGPKAVEEIKSFM